MSLAAFQLSEICVFFVDAVSDDGAEGACVSELCTMLVALPDALCAALATSDVLTCTEYVPAATADGGVTTNVALLVAPGDRLIVDGERVVAHPAGAVQPTLMLLAGQAELSRLSIAAV